ncbi:MAG: TIGR02757 family protein [Bacteroidaceae bacterium]|nr:TIGR02757 family protein [Bacteroidaceae bacterium]
MERIKALLDGKAAQYNTPQFIADDPISFPHSFTRKEDVEIVALLASVIAWGNRRMILRSGNRMFREIMQSRPYEYVMGGEWEDLDDRMNIHRTFFAADFKYICRGLRSIYYEHGSMEPLFAGCSVWDGIENLRQHLASANGGATTRHISNPIPTKGKPASACKRMHMMLRWLCRKDGIVDLGIWNCIPQSELMIPIDVHVARTARALGLVTRKQNDRRTVEELTARLRELSPEDPVRYDFALFGVGEAGDEFVSSNVEQQIQ